MKFFNKVEELNKQALEEAVALLKQSEKGKFIAVRYDNGDLFDTTSAGNVPIGIYGVGLDENDHIKIKAVVTYIGEGYCEEDYPSRWVDITEEKDYSIDSSCYPAMYRFVAQYIDRAVPWEEVENATFEDACDY